MCLRAMFIFLQDTRRRIVRTTIACELLLPYYKTHPTAPYRLASIGNVIYHIFYLDIERPHFRWNDTYICDDDHHHDSIVPNPCSYCSFEISMSKT